MPNENYFNPGIQYKQMGSGSYGEPVWGNVGYTSDDLLKNAQAKQLKFNQDLQTKKFGMVQGLLGQVLGGGGLGGSGSASMSFGGGPGVPAPHYLGYQPVYGQGQVDNMAGLQRANLMQQAGTQTQGFANQLGARGFSPMSPLGGIVGQQNLGRAYGAAAQNETNLNFQAAGANSDARIKTAGVNAGMYGDYIKSLLGMDQMKFDASYKSQGLQQQLLQTLLGQLG